MEIGAAYDACIIEQGRIELASRLAKWVRLRAGKSGLHGAQNTGSVVGYSGSHAVWVCFNHSKQTSSDEFKMINLFIN